MESCNYYALRIRISLSTSPYTCSRTITKVNATSSPVSTYMADRLRILGRRWKSENGVQIQVSFVNHLRSNTLEKSMNKILLPLTSAKCYLSVNEYHELDSRISNSVQLSVTPPAHASLHHLVFQAVTSLGDMCRKFGDISARKIDNSGLKRPIFLKNQLQRKP